MHFTKPNPEYYREIAERIGHASKDCIMVGDELDNNIQPAAETGMHTFWVTDEPADDHPADWVGTLLDVKRLIDTIIPPNR